MCWKWVIYSFFWTLFVRKYAGNVGNHRQIHSKSSNRVGNRADIGQKKALKYFRACDPTYSWPAWHDSARYRLVHDRDGHGPRWSSGCRSIPWGERSSTHHHHRESPWDQDSGRWQQTDGLSAWEMGWTIRPCSWASRSLDHKLRLFDYVLWT